VSSSSSGRVSCHTDWDPLEEVVVGRLEGAAIMPWESGYAAVVPVEEFEEEKAFHLEAGGCAIPPASLLAAQRELDEFIRVLEGEGVRVRRPDVVDFSKPYGTPHWQSAGGNCVANPRDVLLVIGDEIIEAPMALRGRYFEFTAYRTLIKEYFAGGARWAAAPKPVMSDELYQEFERGKSYVTTEHEPVFDAADFARCGRDIFAQRSHVTNLMGIEWVRRHIGSDYTVHTLEFDDYRAVHIDATFVPLAPGKLLLNPDRPPKGGLPSMFARAGWDVLVPPSTTLARDAPGYHGFRWLHMNTLMLDEKRVIVERSQSPMIEALQSWGFQPIPVAFANNYKFGGSFHCATADIRRRGELKSYF